MLNKKKLKQHLYVWPHFLDLENFVEESTNGNLVAIAMTNLRQLNIGFPGFDGTNCET